MRSNYKINIFLENKKWLNKKIFNSKKIMEYYFKSLATMTIKECLLKPKFKKFRNVKININLILSDDNFLKKLNTNFLNKKKSTNVLSFPNENFFKKKENFLGEIYLSYELCKKEAKKFKMNEKQRSGHLIIHGILHLFGFNHETKKDEKKMIAVESKILNFLGINYY
ncbi:MAG: Endoribonuclease YbeY [Alphaproteobacteria bacterium MarineAlpha6_Bin4]|nr:MAG: Endoribonuclease YbeY [Alphaproteobacteria bacterium MarineAlpha6_Bin4]|tara:strand:- start:2816 stop:3319 length:504 start_codon:yes stop_codon:yes gene_type:complete